jgi:peroxiredoxin
VRSLLFSGLITILLVLPACGQAESVTVAEGPEPDDPVVARINDFELRQSQLDQELAFERATYLLTTGRELTRPDPEEKLERLVTSVLIDQQALEAGISSSDEEITAALEAFVQERNSSVEALEAALVRQRSTLADFRENIARTVRVEKYLSEVVLAGAETADQQQEQLAAWLGNIQDSAEVELLYEPPAAAPVIDAAAPDFTLTNLDGEEVSLSDFRGRPVIVNFWATWCVPCRREMPAFQRAFEAYQADDLVILALDVEENAAQVEPFVEELGLTFEVLYDSQGEVNDTYQVTGLPRTVFIDRQGVIRHIQVGEVQEVLLKGFLDRIL